MHSVYYYLIHHIFTEYPLLPLDTVKQKKQTIFVLVKRQYVLMYSTAEDLGDLSQLKYFGQKTKGLGGTLAGPKVKVDDRMMAITTTTKSS